MVVVNKMKRGQTIVPNDFIDYYLADASGEYVKVYIMFLRLSDKGEMSVSALADELRLTEKDVMRALNYWQEKGLVELSEGEDSDSAKSAKEPALKKAHKRTANEILEVDESFARAIYVTEQFLSRQLKSDDISLITWLYDEMHFSADLIEYLAEYCATIGKKRTNYIKAVAEGWIKDGIKTPEEAKKQAQEFSSQKKKGTAASGNKFHNFDQRTDDLNALIDEEIKNGSK